MRSFILIDGNSPELFPEFFYHDQHQFYLSDGHSFPISKYALLRQRVIESGLLPEEQLSPGPSASDSQLALAHTPEYITKVDQGGLTERENRRTGFPWSPELAMRSRRSVGSTIAACRSALRFGFSANLGGGTHHAHADFGQGYCVYNDVAVAALLMQLEGLAKEILICDCDVHQGNGTASILQNNPSVYTFSIHGDKNFPFSKSQSTLDVGLKDGTRDAEYLDALDGALEYISARFTPDLVIYLAGADPFYQDRLGRLALTKQGLLQRDQMIFSTFLSHGIPVAVTMSGGYANQVADIVDIHFGTLQTGLEIWRRVQASG
ncbi:MAG TPA: histone deacetylase [Anaerolineales bacterium]|jgi:acetoin utilization deacetylase AcuC-like enzyme|nr:histone deacetylase [Anaerolineales bacterium]